MNPAIPMSILLILKASANTNLSADFVIGQRSDINLIIGWIFTILVIWNAI